MRSPLKPSRSNFSELFKSIEEYEKSLETKQAGAVQQS
jgi:hypothetical protein